MLCSPIDLFIRLGQVMGNASEFQRAVQLVIDHVSFDNDNVVQVFEATIRLVAFCRFDLD